MYDSGSVPRKAISYPRETFCARSEARESLVQRLSCRGGGPVSNSYSIVSKQLDDNFRLRLKRHRIRLRRQRSTWGCTWCACQPLAGRGRATTTPPSASLRCVEAADPIPLPLSLSLFPSRFLSSPLSLTHPPLHYRILSLSHSGGGRHPHRPPRH
jgi:hypothetical protein